ncbi:MAG: DNA repair protein RadA [Candidatus Gracilibacteria bacterium]|nr:DNA repair protein RadA [Candidatus Gracilibacteria bacterium]
MYKCNSCSYETLKWTGQCPSCKEWNTMLEKIEEVETKKPGSKNNIKGETQILTKLGKASFEENRIITESKELNNLLGNGIIEGSVILLSGEPGIGKSTLSLQLANWIKDKNITYVSGEETIEQLSVRAKRLGITGDNISVLAENNFENILQTLKNINSDIIILDSISVIVSNNMTGASGSINQIRYITEELIGFAKKTNTTVFIIGHVTKDGSISGPKTLEHMVDTVLFFEGDRFDNIRLLRSLKNRFGNTNEIAIFKMTDKGLSDLSDPSLEFVTNDKDDTIGSSLSMTVEGSRAFLVETESLITYTKFGYPKRNCKGINNSRLDMIIASLAKYTKVNLDSYDVYINIVRGLKIEEPGIDLAIAASIISSKTNKAIPKDSVFIGEISLTGRITNVVNIEKRVKEAQKYNFAKIYIPANSDVKTSKNIVKLKNLEDLVKVIV